MSAADWVGSPSRGDASPFYRELYRHPQPRLDDPTLLPVSSKKMLMPQFDDWVTDRAVTGAQARALVEDPDRVGQRLAGRYLVVTSSGVTGQRGVFLHDDRTNRVGTALSVRMMGDWLTAGDLARIVVRGGRMAVVVATGGHFAGFVGATRMQGAGGLGGRLVRVFAVDTPLPELSPGSTGSARPILAGYASTPGLLAGEQASTRLQIDPVLVQPTSEGLPPGGAERMAGVFHAKVRTAYNASECLNIGHGCQYGWQHIISDWVVLEPVDADHRPVPAGEQSHTVLLSNLANRVQPILRYDLGDSVIARPDPCPRGRPAPPIRVRGPPWPQPIWASRWALAPMPRSRPPISPWSAGTCWPRRTRSGSPGPPRQPSRATCSGRSPTTSPPSRWPPPASSRRYSRPAAMAFSSVFVVSNSLRLFRFQAGQTAA
jgi:hypothetical protein